MEGVHTLSCYLPLFFFLFCLSLCITLSSSAYSRRHDEGKPHIFVTLSAVITSPFYALFSSHAGYPNLSWYASSSM